MKAILLGLVLFASPAFAAPPFDLTCHGSSSVDNGPSDPWSDEFRIDLAANRYCDGDCDSGTSKLALVNDIAIYFRKTDDPYSKNYEYVDRKTGAYTKRLRSNGVEIEANGTCDRVPFKGFPAVKRRF